MARVTFLGLNMDVTTQAEIIAAIRGLYPNVVSSADSDNRAVQLVLKLIITEHLKAWASRSALVDTPDVIANQARQQAVDTQVAAASVAGASATADIVPISAT